MSLPASAQPVYLAGKISGGNSTLIPLGSSETFTGRPELTAHPEILTTVKTDVSGTLYVDLSIDNGANYDTTFQYDVSAGGGEFHTAVKGSRTVLIRYVNNSISQSFLRLQTEFGQFGPPRSPLNRILQNDADASIVRSIDSNIDVAIGRFQGFEAVVKFGRAPDGVQTTSTDIWDRADATPTQQIWTAPTQARIHAIVSTSTDDDGSPVGIGAHTITVFGLTDWDSEEVSESITMNGTTPVNTTNAYVIINRLRVTACGASGPNVGTITATAATDGTVTAVIRPTIGSTAMAIFGWPSTQTLLLTDWHADLLDSSGGASDALLRLFHNPDPENYPALYIEKDVRGLQSNGANSVVWPYTALLTLSGPGIIKLNGIASAPDTDVTAGFNGILADN